MTRHFSSESGDTNNGVPCRSILSVISCLYFFSFHTNAFQLHTPPSTQLTEEFRISPVRNPRIQQLRPWQTLLRETKEDKQETSVEPPLSNKSQEANEKRANHPNPTSIKNRNRSNNNNKGSGSNYKGKNFDPAYQRQAEQQKISRELNQKLTGAETAKDLLLVLQNTPGALTSPSGGGKMNNVNFSTSIHRIARHLNQFQYNNNKGNQNQNSHNEQRYSRAMILSDPRFALLLCSLAEALGGVPFDAGRKGTASGTIFFGSREMSNIAWALAKMKIAPPMTASPLLTENNYKTMLLDTSKQLRQKVLQVAKTKQHQQANGVSVSTEEQQQAWIPTMSLLCGYILDTTALRASMATSVNMNSKTPFQERANLLWALATAQRASPVAFDVIVTRMIDDMESLLLVPENQPGVKPPSPQSLNDSVSKGYNSKAKVSLQPQEWSNSLWAFATAQIYGPGQERLIKFVADAIFNQPGFVDSFKPQEFSNTAWGVATLLSKKDSESTQREEQDAALRILRHVAVAVTERADEFKTQELANTLWAFATLGFGMSSKSALDRNMGEGQGPAAQNDYVILPSDNPEEDEKLLVAATDAILASALPRIQRFRSQELNNIAWSLARFNRKDVTTSLRAIGEQLCDPRRKVKPQVFTLEFLSLYVCLLGSFYANALGNLICFLERTRTLERRRGHWQH